MMLFADHQLEMQNFIWQSNPIQWKIKGMNRLDGISLSVIISALCESWAEQELRVRSARVSRAKPKPGV